MCKKHDIKVKNTPGVTNETVLDEIDTLVGQKPDCIIVHADTNDIKRINILNTTKKIERKVKILYPEQDWHSPAKYCEKTKKKKKKLSQKKYLILMIGTAIAIRQNLISLITKAS